MTKRISPAKAGRRARRAEETRAERVERLAYLITLASFILPLGYLFYQCVTAPVTAPAESPDVRVKADYLLMLVECVLGVAVIHLPSMLEKRFRFELPTALTLLYVVFLYCAIFLGEVRDFYYRVPHWDTILHAMSSVMAGVFGFTVVAVLNKNERVAIRLSPLFVALFAFCFAVTLGVLWEIYEYAFDGILGLNMQKFRTAEGVVLSGHAALSDTMKDIMVDAAGALAASLTGYFSLRSARGWCSDIIHSYCDKRDPAQAGNEACKPTERENQQEESEH